MQKTFQLPKILSHSPLRASRALLGTLLTTKIGNKTTSGYIVEVEAYDGRNDAAAHSFRGPTPRSQIMFGPAGYCYVYFIYGMHFCVNVVTGATGHGSAVLIRALEPFEGVDVMKSRRKCDSLEQLTNGPSKLCQALAIDKKMLGQNFFDSKFISLSPGRNFSPKKIEASTRIGITKAVDLKWRFFIKDNRFVTKP